MAEVSFQEQVYQVVRLIPRGRATSYGAIANCLGAKNSSRRVGSAMAGAGKANPPVPAHRVVNSNGKLTGKFHFDSPNEMQNLLEQEGILVKHDRIINFKSLFWDPAIEINL